MRPLIAIDTETGGTVAGRHALLSLGAVTEFGEEFQVWILPTPGMLIEDEAVRKNGYSPERWAALGAVSTLEAGQRFARWLDEVRDKHGLDPEGLTGLGHNAGFDKGFVGWLERVTGCHFGLSYRWECSQAMLGGMIRAGVFPKVRSASLDALCELVGVTGRGPCHEALWDARACLKGYQLLLALIHGMTQAVVKDAQTREVSRAGALAWSQEQSDKVLSTWMLESGFDEQGVAVAVGATGREPQKERLGRPGNPEAWEHAYKLDGAAQI